jgi:hypothetical protein
MDRYERITSRIRKPLLAMAVLGALVLLIGIVRGGEAQLRALAGGLMAVNFVVGLCIGGAFFVAIHYVTNSSWGVVFRRVPEVMTKFLWVALVLTLTVLILGLALRPEVPVRTADGSLNWLEDDQGNYLQDAAGNYLYETKVTHLFSWSDPGHVEHDPILQGKTPWLNKAGFLVRSVVYFLLWIVLIGKIRKNSLAQDESRDPALSASNVRWSSFFLVIMALSVSAASFDWIMSLEPHWFSTMFGVYNFIGMFLSALAMIVIFTLGLERLGVLKGKLTQDHLHSLGKLIFAFSAFWAYIWYCQFMLIWYANIPEETLYYQHRHAHTWEILSYVNVALNFVIPFLILIPRAAKRNAKVLLNVAVILLFGRLVDLYFMVMPSLEGFHVNARIGFTEVLPTFGVVALFVMLFFKWFPVSSPVPSGDPYYAESLHHH